MNLIDHEKLRHLKIESVSENSPVCQDILFAVSLCRTEIEADKIALTNAAAPGAKSMGQEIAGSKRRSLQIFNGTFF
jgi:hypothetical protein